MEDPSRMRRYPGIPAPATALLAALSALSAFAAGPSPSPEFLRYWKSGLAELSSYEIVTARYGEPRKAQGVMIFVYEEIDDQTRVKVESGRVPPARRVPVLKLNNVLKFNTGVYDYSVMTSVFAGLSGPGVTRPFEPRKVSFSSQEWCGHVYHHLLPRKEGIRSEIHSYFEAEGDAEALIPWPRGRAVRYEDEMPILVRELEGEALKAGDSLAFRMVPSLWGRRKRHAPLLLVDATLRKDGPETLETRSGPREALRWTLRREGGSMTYWVETAPPRKLLAWDDGDGEKGELTASLRKTYWERNRNRDEPLRKELGLRYGLDGG